MAIYKNINGTAELFANVSNGGDSGASALYELADVELSALSDGDVLVYDSANEKWINKASESAQVIQRVTSPSAPSSMSNVAQSLSYTIYGRQTQIAYRLAATGSTTLNANYSYSIFKPSDNYEIPLYLGSLLGYNFALGQIVKATSGASGYTYTTLDGIFYYDGSSKYYILRLTNSCSLSSGNVIAVFGSFINSAS